MMGRKDGQATAVLCYSARDETEVDLGKRKKAEDLNITCLDPVCFISNLCECFY